MPYRTPARWLAPLALVVAALAVLAAVTGGGGAGSGGAPSGSTGRTTSSSTDTSAAPASAVTASTTAPAQRTYTVVPGDVLSRIAEKTGVPLDRLEALNPDVDAQTLRAGQKLKLAP